MRAAGESDAALLRLVRPLWGAQGAALGLGLVQALTVAALLGATSYGEAALYLGAPALLVALINPQAEEAIVRFVAEQRSIVGGRPWTVVVLGVVLEGALLLIAVVIAAFAVYPLMSSFGVPSAQRWLVVAATVGVASSSWTSTFRAVFAAADAVNRIAPTSLVAAVVRTLSTIGLAAGFGAEGFVAGFALAGIAESLIFGAVAYRLGNRAFGGFQRGLPGRSDTRRILRFVGFSGLTTMASSLVKHADLLILGWFRPSAEVGVYRLARSAVSPLGSVALPLTTVAYPRLSTLAAEGDWEAFRHQLRQYHRVIGRWLAIAGGVLTPLAFVSLNFIYGSEYEGIGAVAAILLVGSLVSVIMFWLRPALLAIGAIRALFILSLAGGLMTAVGYVVLADRFGAMGIAVARAVFAGALAQVFAWKVLRRHLDRKPTNPQIAASAS